MRLEDVMPCKLAPVPNSSDFEGPAGQQVTLVTKDHIGTVLIAKAEYAGNQLVPAGLAVNQIQLTVAPGPKTLKMVFVFSASTTGRGELREDCGADSQFLRDVAGDEPFQLIRIIG